MAADGLSELISVTSNVMKSLSESKLSNDNDSNSVTSVCSNGSKRAFSYRKMDQHYAGSPFESPKSLTSQPDSGMGKTETKAEPSFPRGIDSRVKTDKATGNNRSNASTREKKVSMNSTTNNADQRSASEIMVRKHHQEKGESIVSPTPQQSHDCKYNARHVLNEKGKSIAAKFENDNLIDEEQQIIDVQAKSLEMSLSSGVGEENVNNTDDPIFDANLSQSGQYFPQTLSAKTSNSQCQSLKQGALSKGAIDPTKQSVFDDVYISQFHSSEGQRGVRETLAKRSENSKPKKQNVQPQIIKNQKGNESDKDSVKYASRGGSETASEQPYEADPSVTAAVAASAAVAVTQPFIKAQQELESRMQQLLTQLTKTQEMTDTVRGDQAREKMNSTALGKDEMYSTKRISDLEHQVAEMNERRLEHLESLQQQQMQMQAQLLMMSRSKSPHNHIKLPAHQVSPTRRQESRIPLAKTKKEKANSLHERNQLRSSHHEPVGSQLQSSYFNPETLSKHHNYLSEVRELQGSLLDTPAPRKTVPEPTPYSLLEEPQKNLGFLQELLDNNETPVKDTTFSKSPGLSFNRNNNAKSKRFDKSPVDQARRLVNSLSTLEQQTAESLWGSREALNNKDLDHIVHDGPAPLEYYLKYPKTEGSPYPNFGDPKQERETKQRRRSAHANNYYMEAKEVLKQLETTKDTLERNLEQVVRSRRDVHVFNALLAGASEGGSNDQMRIEKMVSKKIASLHQDVQRAVLRGLAEEEAKKLAAEVEQARLKAAAKKTAGRIDYSRNNTFKQMVEEAKLNQAMVGQTSRHPDNAKQTKSVFKKPLAKPNVIKDEKTLTRTYGKAEYQRGRTTIREPYLHFQNTKKGRPVGMNDSMVSRDGRSRSPKSKKILKSTEESQVPRQYFFSPTRGYIPLENGSSGPIEGHIVPMAIPLGAPRMEPGVRKSATPVASRSPDPITSTPVPVTAVTRNAAVISLSADVERDRMEKEPELSKQVLPPIDIDSISPSSSRLSDIQIRSPQHAHPNVTFLCETFDEDNLNMNRHLEDDSDEDQTGEGINLPGYEPQMPGYTGPSFPPQQSSAKPDWMAGGEHAREAPLVSNVMAEDLRRRDVLENNAVTWLEQELMARVLTEVMPLKVPIEPTDISTAHSAKSEDSERDDSLLVADMIGQGGLQLFIDAGQPVDNALVNALVKEVLQEKVNSMLAQRANDGEAQRYGSETKNREETEVLSTRREQSEPPQIPTPEMTPKASPVASPRRVKPQIQQPETPPMSPPSNANTFTLRKDIHEDAALAEVTPSFQQPPLVMPQPRSQPVPSSVSQAMEVEKAPVPEIESESETSVSVDISEELRLIGKAVAEPQRPVEVCHDIATPPNSPSPVEEAVKPTIAPIQTTPPASPPPAQPAVSAEHIPLKPRPEHLPEPRIPEKAKEEEEAEEEEEDIVEQPKPIMMSVAVGDDRPMSSVSSDREQQVQRRSPSPQRKRAQSVQSPTSDSQLLSEESTLSDSVNENISEGQWLLSRSEGQIVGLPGKVNAHDLKRGYQQMVDLSTASTLRDTEDLDLDESHVAKSEGEILISGLPAPEQDPMLELLVQMQKNPLLAIQKDLSRTPMAQASLHQDQRNVTGRSLGEMSVGQVAPSRLVQVKPRKAEERQRREHTSPSYSPTHSLERSLTEDNYSHDYEEDKKRGTRGASVRQQRRTPSPQRSPQRQQRQSSGHAHQQQQQQYPRNRSPDFAPRGYGSAQQSGARSKTRGQMQYQPVLSDAAPAMTRTRTPSKYDSQRARGESHRLSRSSEQGYRMSGSSNFRQSGNSVSDLYSTDQMTRSADSLSMRRSGEGVLTSSLKSKQSNVKKSVEFDLTGTFGRTRSSVSRSRDSHLTESQSSRLSDAGASLGLNYSFEESVDDSELRRIMGDNGLSYGPYRMSVTLPSTGHGDDSDISEIDISHN